MPYPVFATENNKQSCVGPKVARAELSLTNTNRTLVDFTPYIQNGQIDMVQSLFVDNINNPERLIIEVGTTGQRIVIPAYSQAYVPVLTNNYARMEAYLEAVPAGTVTVNIFGLNFPVYAHVWTANP
jgi:hypothetical protein